jgi:hypothetical protein
LFGWVVKGGLQNTWDKVHAWFDSDRHICLASEGM